MNEDLEELEDYLDWLETWAVVEGEDPQWIQSEIKQTEALLANFVLEGE